MTDLFTSWRDWFNQFGKNIMHVTGDKGGTVINIEEHYQMIKARLIEETTVTEIPEGNRVE